MGGRERGGRRGSEVERRWRWKERKGGDRERWGGEEREGSREREVETGWRGRERT